MGKEQVKPQGIEIFVGIVPNAFRVEDSGINDRRIVSIEQRITVFFALGSEVSAHRESPSRFIGRDERLPQILSQFFRKEPAGNIDDRPWGAGDDELNGPIRVRLGLNSRNSCTKPKHD
jgi:hypothetical protein